MSLSSFFTHIKTNQSVGGAKTGVPGEKPPQQNMACLTYEFVPRARRKPTSLMSCIMIM